MAGGTMCRVTSERGGGGLGCIRQICGQAIADTGNAAIDQTSKTHLGEKSVMW